MKPFSKIAKRVLLASGLALLAACSGNGPTDPTSARNSGYLTVSAAVSRTTASGYNVPAAVSPTQAGPGTAGTTSTSGYNVPAN